MSGPRNSAVKYTLSTRSQMIIGMKTGRPTPTIHMWFESSQYMRARKVRSQRTMYGAAINQYYT